MVLIRSENSYKGLIKVKKKNYFFEIEDCDQLQLNQKSLKLDWRLNMVLGSSLNEFLNQEFHDVKHFYNLFCDFISTKVGNQTEGSDDDIWLSDPLSACTLIKNLTEDIKSEWEFIKNVDAEKRLVDIEIADANFRTHKAILKLGENYPRERIEVLYHDLPSTQKAGLNLGVDIYYVSEFCKKFIELIKLFQEFWNVISLVDLQCQVLDPPNPTYKDVFRRIKIRDTLSVGITVNPLQPRQMPNIKLFGCQSDVNSCEEVLQNNLEKELWDSEEDLVYNISNVLDVTILKRTFNEDVDLFDSVEEIECAICFTWRLNNLTPDEVCETPNCKSFFHSSCLFTYLSSLHKNQVYFGRIQGACPNCDNIISCPVPKFL